MKPIFEYRGKTYGYMLTKIGIVLYRICRKKPEDGFEFDDEMQKQLEEEFSIYEATLTSEELTVWKGTSLPNPRPFDKKYHIHLLDIYEFQEN